LSIRSKARASLAASTVVSSTRRLTVAFMSAAGCAAEAAYVVTTIPRRNATRFMDDSLPRA
jgi:hypothetical protein